MWAHQERSRLPKRCNDASTLSKFPNHHLGCPPPYSHRCFTVTVSATKLEQVQPATIGDKDSCPHTWGLETTTHFLGSSSGTSVFKSNLLTRAPGLSSWPREARTVSATKLEHGRTAPIGELCSYPHTWGLEATTQCLEICSGTSVFRSNRTQQLAPRGSHGFGNKVRTRANSSDRRVVFSSAHLGARGYHSVSRQQLWNFCFQVQPAHTRTRTPQLAPIGSHGFGNKVRTRANSSD
jgi:hypothetical protein